MNFPLPIRSLSTNEDFFKPLFVDTNIVYKLDETKFPGYLECPPALLVDPTVPPDSCKDVFATPDHTWEDLYNLIDSLEVDVTEFLSSDEWENILDLCDNQLELITEETSVSETNSTLCTSVSKMQSAEKHPLDYYNDCLNSLSLDTETSNITDQSRDDIQSLRCETHFYRNSSYTMTKIRGRPNRKRHMSSATLRSSNSIETEEQTRSKRRKIDQNGFNLTNYSVDLSFDNVLTDLSSQMSFYLRTEYHSEFNFSNSPIMGFFDRQL